MTNLLYISFQVNIMCGLCSKVKFAINLKKLLNPQKGRWVLVESWEIVDKRYLYMVESLSHIKRIKREGQNDGRTF
ncbi:MAG: hypothetical protein PWP31_141 [Clostridia bacterium]|nr:hypothetical protein [Clostridia bacterium]